MALNSCFKNTLCSSPGMPGCRGSSCFGKRVQISFLFFFSLLLLLLFYFYKVPCSSGWPQLLHSQGCPWALDPPAFQMLGLPMSHTTPCYPRCFYEVKHILSTSVFTQGKQKQRKWGLAHGCLPAPNWTHFKCPSRQKWITMSSCDRTPFQKSWSVGVLTRGSMKLLHRTHPASCHWQGILGNANWCWEGPVLSGAEGGCRGASKALRRKENTFRCSDDYVTV